MIQPQSIKYQLAEKQQAIAAGGIGTLLALTKGLELRTKINQAIPLFKLHLPYDEADHGFNIAMNCSLAATALSISKTGAVTKPT